MALRIELPEHGCLELHAESPAAAALVFVALDGEIRRLEGSSLLRGEDGPLAFALGAAGHTVLLGRRRSDRLYLFDAAAGRLQPVALGERILGSEELRIAAAGDLFVVLTENGVLAIEPCGRERWRIERVSYAWHFALYEGGSVFLTDAAGNVLAFDAMSGEEIA